MAIDRLGRISTLGASDLIALFSTSLGGDAVATLTTLIAFIQTQLNATGGFVSQYSAPSSTGFSVTITPTVTGENVYLLLTPTGTLAAGTIVMPAAPVHAQEVLVACTQIVTTLTVSGNTYTINGAPTTFAANGFFRMRFDGVLNTWNRVG